MSSELLIETIVRQTTVLIAQLATAGGIRTPLADVAEQVFLDLVRELERQGVSRKVAADMFGMALRTFRRRLQRLSESRTHANRSLWEAVYSFVGTRDIVAQSEVLREFHRDEEELVRGVLNDLVESGLVFRSGKGASAKYRSARGNDREHHDGEDERETVDALIAAIVYRFGPLTPSELSRTVSLSPAALQGAIGRLTATGQLVRAGVDAHAALSAPALVRPLGTPAGWEAAVFDHYQALVNTVSAKLRAGREGAKGADLVGGSTYTLEVWPGHPLEAEALSQLAVLRKQLSDLRTRVAAHNQSTQMPEQSTRVIVYFGQNVIECEEESR